MRLSNSPSVVGLVIITAAVRGPSAARNALEVDVAVGAPTGS